MKKLTPVCFLLYFLSVQAYAGIGKSPRAKEYHTGTFYFSWGYNKDYFSISTLHLYSRSGHYDFTLADVKAKDRTGFRNILHSDLTIPQYVYRAGFYFNNHLNSGIEINFDHAKYVMVNDQVLRLKGTIEGYHFDKDTLVDKNFLLFEHTNGANFLMVNYLRKHDLLKPRFKKKGLATVLKIGGGMVIPKTDVTLFGTRLDNKFHIAGYIAGVDYGLRYHYKYVFVEGSSKLTYANYVNVLTVGDGKANHNFYTLEIIAALGFQLPVRYNSR
jgi:hypothetical protein